MAVRGGAAVGGFARACMRRRPARQRAQVSDGIIATRNAPPPPPQVYATLLLKRPQDHRRSAVALTAQRLENKKLTLSVRSSTDVLHWNELEPACSTREPATRCR